jgi:molybdopterin converting factor small subunit
MTTQVEIKTRLLLFGRLAEQLGREHDVKIPADGCTIAELRKSVAADNENLTVLAGSGVVAAIDQQVAADDAWVRPGQEIAFFSPLSGG